MNKILRQFGNIDVYLFDQLLKGRFNQWNKVLDAGCGTGRNLLFFLQNNFDVYGIDPHQESIEQLQLWAQNASPKTNPNNFVVGDLTSIPFEKEYFDLVICNAVLHFAKDEAHFDNMLRSIWEVLKPGGDLIVRLASDIGIEQLVEPLGNRIFNLPDGSRRFLVNQQMLLDYTEELGGELFEYIKTTNVQNLRCMTTWCLQKK